MVAPGLARRALEPAERRTGWKPVSEVWTFGQDLTGLQWNRSRFRMCHMDACRPALKGPNAATPAGVAAGSPGSGVVPDPG